MNRHLAIERIRTRLSPEEGFTLIELLIVVQILGILIAIAAPSYLAFRDRANKTAASANVRTLLDDIEQYNADNYPSSRIDPDPATSTSDTGYAGMTISELRTIYDPGIPSSDWVDPGDSGIATGVVIPAPTSSSYCAVASVGRWYAWKLGPGGAIEAATTAASACR